MSGICRPATIRSAGVPSLTLRDASQPTTRKATYIARTAATAAVMSGILTAGAAAFQGRRRLVGFARDHHLGGLDDCQRVVASFEVQFLERIRSDDGRRRLVADAQPDLPEQTVDAHLFDEAAQPVAAAQRDDHAGRPWRRPRLTFAGRRMPGEKAFDLRLRQSMVAARGLRRPNLALMNPLLQGRVPDPHSFRSGSDG